MNSLVSIIIPTWNGRHYLEKCLPSLLSQTLAKQLQIVVVDNHSTDDTTSWLRKKYPQVVLIELAHNEGFAQSNNLGFKRAMGKYVLFLNNDTVCTPDCVQNLIAVLESDQSIAGVQGKLLLMDNPTRLDSIGAFLTPTGFLYHNHFGEKDRKEFDSHTDLYTAKGACMMFKKEALKRILVNELLFDPSYFAYFEETDMCHRIWLSGKRIVYAPEGVVFHTMGGTSTTMNNDFIQYHSFKNRIRTYLKNLESTKLIGILSVHLLMCEAFSLASLIKGKFSLALAIQRAIAWNIVNFTSTLYMRRYVQTVIRKVTDEKYFSHVLKHPGLRYYMALSRGARSYEK